ncbi:F0F1 ATP synthase subunit epsilon [Bacillaceae bacterium]
MSTMLVEIVTPDRVVYSSEAKMVVAKGVEGDLGILPHHVPLVTPLKIAPVRIKKDEGEDVVAVSSGFMEVRGDKVTILAEAAELPEEIDIDRALAAKERAERRLAQSGQEDIDFQRAKLALQRALMRLQVGQQKK